MRILKLLVLVTGLFLTCSALAASPLGYWKTIDDVSKQPKSIIYISADASGHLTGKVVKLFENAVKFVNNKPVLGMVIMEGMKQNADNPLLWMGGNILDPKTGKNYHCNLQVSQDDQKLLVRGYIGLPLLGRTQTWIRVTDAQDA